MGQTGLAHPFCRCIPALGHIHLGFFIKGCIEFVPEDLNPGQNLLRLGCFFLNQGLDGLISFHELDGHPAQGIGVHKICFRCEQILNVPEIRFHFLIVHPGRGLGFFCVCNSLYGSQKVFFTLAPIHGRGNHGNTKLPGQSSLINSNAPVFSHIHHVQV